MATMLHDPAVRDSIRGRVQRLTSDATRAWGKMSVDQMLWHVNMALKNALEQPLPTEQRFPVPKAVLRFLVLNLPWTKGAPTGPDLVAVDRYDFEAERQRCLQLIDEFTNRKLDETDWVESSSFGEMTGRQWSRFQAKHLDHHLKQFSV